MLIARVLRRYSTLSAALLLALCTVAEPAYAQLQGIGLAGAYAVEGQQSQTSQTTPDIVSGTDAVTLGVGTPTSKLKLGVVESDKPVSVTVRFPAPVYRDLEAYSEAHPEETQQPKIGVKKLIVPMVVHFLATDRGLSTARKRTATQKSGA